MDRRSVSKWIYASIVLAMIQGCNKREKLFEKIDIVQAGIEFENKLSPTEDFNIIDYLYFYNGGGVAVGDINGDDLPDIFFSGNQVRNKLYLNRGNLKFEDITDKAGVGGNSSWNTGAVMADVNGDGLLDIYVCAVVGLKNLRGLNELYINNGDNTFTERAAEFGLDFDSYSSSAVFLDYDLDGDLDMYLLNHAVHTQGSFARASARNIRTYETGDKLMRNDGGKFVDVSEQAGIYGGITGYGLGVAVSDFNLDGFPDIFVGNDFHEDDYFYINNGDGTFRESAKDVFTITSKFSMGNDVADINHDGLPDLITLDMLAADEKVVKRSESDDNISIMRLRTQEYGYGYQFQRNMLQVNQGDGTFAETALISNVAATDWSWSALFADFNHDGHQDLFISNGIPARPNDLDYIKYVSNEKIVNTIGNTKLVDQKALSLMPSGKTQNYVFQGSGDLAFVDKSLEWLPEELTCSTAAAIADLDNDGDLDIIVNNVDDRPGIYINQTNGAANYLKVRLDYSKGNKYGIGTRLYCYQDGLMSMREMYTARGFQASSEPLVHFGLGSKATIDSLEIVWPDGKTRVLKQIDANKTIVISPESGHESVSPAKSEPASFLFESIDQSELGITFRHVEDSYTDFDRLKLLPYQQSDRGPASAIGDINNDGRIDIYFGGSKHIPGQFYIQGEDRFVKTSIPDILKDSIKEDTEAVIEDFNNDGKADIFLGTGGADFFHKAAPLLDSYYESSADGFTLKEIPGYYENASCVRPFDFDGDGDIDLFVGNQSVSNDFGRMPKSYLLKNESGSFTPTQVELFENLGMVTDAVWNDYDGDGKMDLIVVGEWMKPVFLRNNNDVFELQSEIVENKSAGLWQAIIPFDIDHDGDTDYVLGNWGLNSKFIASNSHPMRMYYNDFDQNGTFETIVAVAKGEEYYPLDGLDLLAGQMPGLRKKYTSYESFAGSPIDKIFSKEQLGKSNVYEVHQLGSGYLLNEGGKFSFVPFSPEMQLAPIMAMIENDFDGDGKKELLVGGNYFGVQPFHGRFGSFQGAIIKSTNEILNGRAVGLRLMNRSVRAFHVFPFKGSDYLMATVNNGPAQFYRIAKK